MVPSLCARSASIDPSSFSAARVTSRNCSWPQMSAKERLRRLSKLFQLMSKFSEVGIMLTQLMMSFGVVEM